MRLRRVRPKQDRDCRKSGFTAERVWCDGFRWRVSRRRWWFSDGKNHGRTGENNAAAERCGNRGHHAKRNQLKPRPAL